MKAIIFDKFGDSSVLKTSDITLPDLKDDEVTVAIAFTSVNPVDAKIRAGHLVEMLFHKLPIVPGWDVAGKVTAVGSTVSSFKVGDEVYAYARKAEVHDGTYAEFINLSESAVALKPSTLELSAAAAIPLVGLTAYQSLFNTADLKKGETVFITAGAGGVGSLAIQFAKVQGATVITTASSKNHEYLKTLGADHTIDYTKGNVVESVRKIAPQGVDVVFDASGGDSLDEAWLTIKKGGRLVSIVQPPDENKARELGVQATFVFVEPSGAELTVIAQLIDAKKVKTPTINIRSVKEAAKAQDENEQRKTQGKVVLAIDF
jgi:NADPH:quinone reductase-like Zn-dependent oxidoreductase